MAGAVSRGPGPLRAGARGGRVTGGIVWLTGLSGAGKSTLATALAARLAPLRPVELLDGDDVRTFLSAGLGFSRADRDTNVHRIAYVGRLLARHGVLVLVAAISPYAATRDRLRELSRADGHPFVEVFVNAPLDTVIERDVKGLYRRAQAGEIPSFTGILRPVRAARGARGRGPHRSRGPRELRGAHRPGAGRPPAARAGLSHQLQKLGRHRRRGRRARGGGAGASWPPAPVPVPT